MIGIEYIREKCMLIQVRLKMGYVVIGQTIECTERVCYKVCVKMLCHGYQPASS